MIKPPTWLDLFWAVVMVVFSVRMHWIHSGFALAFMFLAGCNTSSLVIRFILTIDDKGSIARREHK